MKKEDHTRGYVKSYPMHQQICLLEEEMALIVRYILTYMIERGGYTMCGNIGTKEIMNWKGPNRQKNGLIEK